MNGIARIRIGRVTLKAGGADLRVLHQPLAPHGVVPDIMRWARQISDDPQPPCAFVAIAFWPNDKEPWRLSRWIAWQTNDTRLPMPTLMQTAASAIACEAPVLTAEDRIMRDLGYSTDDDTDGAA